MAHRREILRGDFELTKLEREARRSSQGSMVAGDRLDRLAIAVCEVCGHRIIGDEVVLPDGSRRFAGQCFRCDPMSGAHREG